MAYEFHDTAHIEKRARERGFTVEQAMFTINEPASILKTPPRCGNHVEFTWLFFRPFESGLHPAARHEGSRNKTIWP